MLIFYLYYVIRMIEYTYIYHIQGEINEKDSYVYFNNFYTIFYDEL